MSTLIPYNLNNSKLKDDNFELKISNNENIENYQNNSDIYENYENNEVPLSVMATDLLKTYKYGWKTSYYQNTYDMKTDEVVEVKDDPLPVQEDLDNEECEACAI